MDLESAGLHVVRTEAGIWALESLLLGERETPVVVLSQSEETLQPVLPAEKVRAIVGPHAVIYYLPGEYLLHHLTVTLGADFAVSRGSVRIFWPGLSSESDPFDHPLIAILDDEPERDALREFARQFDLSRPPVRHEIKLIEDARSLLQAELDDANNDLRATAEQLRDANIARHEALMRAEHAEKPSTDG